MEFKSIINNFNDEWFVAQIHIQLQRNDKSDLIESTIAILYIYLIFYLIKFSCVNSSFSFPFEDKAFFSSFLFILKDLLASFEVVALSDTALLEEVEQLCFPTASFSSLLFRSLDSSSSALLTFEIVSITENNQEFCKYLYKYKIWQSVIWFHQI